MRVAVVTVNWNQSHLTAACVASVAGGTHVPASIIVVDNGSQMDPTPSIHATHPDVVVLRNDCNRGYAAGANRGIEYALRAGAEAVLVMNNDAVAAPACVSELVAALQRDERLAGVGAKTLTQEQPPRIHTAYGVLTYHGPL